MKTASTKKFLAVMSALQANLPAGDVDAFPDDLATEIIRGSERGGAELMRFLLAGAKVNIVGNHEINCDADPFVPKDWELEAHKKDGILKWDPSQLKLHLSPNQLDGKVIEGYKLRKELESEPALNANVLDYLLAHTELIPEEWKGKYIFFWGTIYRRSDGRLYVRYLCWFGARWHWRCGWLGGGFGGSDPALLRAK